MAAALGVTQATVSRWENGRDIPSIEISRRITDLIATQIRDELAIESRFVERLSSVQAIFDIDGIRLQAASSGCVRAWPLFSRLAGRAFESRMIGESRIILDDVETRNSVVKGDIAMIVGISTRHLDLAGDVPSSTAGFHASGFTDIACSRHWPMSPATPTRRSASNRSSIWKTSPRDRCRAHPTAGTVWRRLIGPSGKIYADIRARRVGPIARRLPRGWKSLEITAN